MQAFENGLRPGLHGQVLVSSGHPDLDKITGGGLPLESILLILEDGCSSHHVALSRLFLAEGVACGQNVLYAGSSRPLVASSRATSLEQAFVSWLPGHSDSITGGNEDGGGEEEEDKEEDGTELRIAWQYRRYLTARKKEEEEQMATQRAKARRERLAAASSSSLSSSLSASGAKKITSVQSWCHSFDLTKSMTRSESARGGMIRVVTDQEGEGALISRVVSSVADFLGDVLPHSSPSAPLASPPPLPAIPSAAPPAPSLSTPPSIPVADTLRKPLHPAIAARLAARQAAAKATPSPPVSSNPPSIPTPHPPSSLTAGSIAALHPSSISRLSFLSLGSIDWTLSSPSPHDCSEDDLFRAVFSIKKLLTGSKAVAMLTIPSRLISPSLIARLQRLVHGVIALQPVTDDSQVVQMVRDASSAAGLLRVLRLASLGTLCPVVPDETLFVVRHRRRRLAIRPVDFNVDGEEKKESGASVVKMVCGGPPSASKAIDF